MEPYIPDAGSVGFWIVAGALFVGAVITFVVMTANMLGSRSDRMSDEWPWPYTRRK